MEIIFCLSNFNTHRVEIFESFSVFKFTTSADAQYISYTWRNNWESSLKGEKSQCVISVVYCSHPGKSLHIHVLELGCVFYANIGEKKIIFHVATNRHHSSPHMAHWETNSCWPSIPWVDQDQVVVLNIWWEMCDWSKISAELLLHYNLQCICF